jgi:hypothetical protein
MPDSSRNQVADPATSLSDETRALYELQKPFVEPMLSRTFAGIQAVRPPQHQHVYPVQHDSGEKCPRYDDDRPQVTGDFISQNPGRRGIVAVLVATMLAFGYTSYSTVANMTPASDSSTTGAAPASHRVNPARIG